MKYESVQCGDTTCPFYRNGICEFNAFEELPCQELSEEEFGDLKIEMEEKGE